MQLSRSFFYGLAVLLSCISLLALAAAMPSGAQQAADNGSENIGVLPLSFILDSSVDAHAQDIEDRMFEYQFDAANNSPAIQSELVLKRSEALQNDTLRKKKMLQAIIKDDGRFSGDQMARLADAMNASIIKLDGRSKKLLDHASGLKMPNDHGANIQPLMSDINDTKVLALEASRDAKNKKDHGMKNTFNSGPVKGMHTIVNPHKK